MKKILIALFILILSFSISYWSDQIKVIELMNNFFSKLDSNNFNIESKIDHLEWIKTRIKSIKNEKWKKLSLGSKKICLYIESSLNEKIAFYKSELENDVSEVGAMNFADTLQKEIVFSSKFDNISDFDWYYITPEKSNTVTHELYTENDNAFHKAWVIWKWKIVEWQNTNHRAYPTVQLYKKNLNTYDKYYIELDVWVDFDITRSEWSNWVSLATMSSYADDFWYRTLLVNVDSNNIVHLMHLPNQSESNQDIFQTTDIKLPMKKWVTIWIYIDYTYNNEYNFPYSSVYQDGKLVSSGRFNQRINPLLFDKKIWPSCLNNWDKKNIDDAEKTCWLKYVWWLSQAHFWLYVPPLFSKWSLYNDNLKIYWIK